MTGLFENLALTDDSDIIANRKASAVAAKRVSDRFGTFLANADDQTTLKARLALVEDDIGQVVRDVVSEHGGDADKITAAIKTTMGEMPMGAGPGLVGTTPQPSQGMAPGQGQTCPTCGGPMVGGQCQRCQGAGAHGGVPGAPAGNYGLNHTMPQGTSTGPVQASASTGEESCPKCGAKAFGGLQCGRCGYSVTDDDREQGRDLDDDDRTNLSKEARRPKMCPYHSEVVDISLGSGEPQAGFNAMASHAWGENHCKGSYEGNCNFRPSMVTQKYWDEKQTQSDERRQQRELERAQQVPELSIDTEPIMHAEPLPVEPGEEGVSDIDGELADAPSAVGAGELAMAASTQKEAEALETVDLPKGDDSALGGPSPKIDKANSGDNFGWSLEPIDTQMDGSPHPTEEQDPTDKADYNKKDFRAQTDAVTTTEDLPTGKGLDGGGFDTERNIKQYPTKTFGDNGTDPVTRTPLSHRTANQWVQKRGDKYVIIQKGTGDVLSTHDSEEKANASFRAIEANKHGAVDSDKNPLREILEEYDGWLMPNQVESALREHGA